MTQDLRRVALFQYEWPLHSHTLNLARVLAGAGVEVDLFIKDCTTGLVDLPAASATPGLAVHDLSGGLSIIERVRRRLRYRAVSERAVREALSIARQGAHQLYIGIEKRGLIWAGTLSERTGVPVVYHSLELYDDDHPETRAFPELRRLRPLEKQFHARARATIVQDEARGAWLLRSNGLSEGELILLPISVAGSAVRQKGRYLRERFRVPPERPILLYLGLLNEPRGCLRIAELARRHAERFAIVLHGYGQPEFVRRLQEAGGGKALVSTDLVEPGRLPELVSSADVGLAFYRRDCANDRLTASSSEKIALYCQAGVPFIAQQSESYSALLAQFRCAEVVADAEGIPAAAESILADYDSYRNDAYRAFEARYRYGAHANRVIAQLANQALP